MRNLIALIVRFGSFITFVVLELLCFYLIVNYNPAQRDIYLNSSNLWSGSILKKRNNINTYLSLEEDNDKLQAENAKLKEEVILLRGFDEPQDIDSTLSFELIPANIIKQDYRFRNNHLTMNKGQKDGVNKDMGVISASGVVGIVKGTSNKFSRALSILNIDTRISAMLKKSEHFGPLVWKGQDPSTVVLQSIPRYAEIEVGDTVITSGLSTIFPKGIDIGYVSNFELEEGTSFYTIDVKLNTDMTALNQVYIIKNLQKAELDSLEIVYE